MSTMKHNRKKKRRMQEKEQFRKLLQDVQMDRIDAVAQENDYFDYELELEQSDLWDEDCDYSQVALECYYDDDDDEPFDFDFDFECGKEIRGVPGKYYRHKLTKEAYFCVEVKDQEQVSFFNVLSGKLYTGPLYNLEDFR